MLPTINSNLTANKACPIFNFIKANIKDSKLIRIGLVKFLLATRQLCGSRHQMIFHWHSLTPGAALNFDNQENLKSLELDLP